MVSRQTLYQTHIPNKFPPLDSTLTCKWYNVWLFELLWSGVTRRVCAAVCRKPASGEGATGSSHTTTGTGAGPGQPHSDPGASTGQPGQQGARPPFLRLRPPRHSRARYSCGLGYDGFGPELAFRLHRLRNRHRGYLSQVLPSSALCPGGIVVSDIQQIVLTNLEYLDH